MERPPHRSAEQPSATADELRAWVVRYGPALRRYFQKKVSASEAEDLVQEVFLAMQVRGTGHDIENIEGYLFKTAAHILSRRGRRRTWDWGRRDELDEEIEPHEHLSPERILIGREDLESAIAAVESLPPRMAEAFVLHRFDEMSYAAIAERMGVTVKTVENLIARAFKRMIQFGRTRI